jgi:prepilin-type N-terminal cleavage/methylation domain-containing protein
VTRRPRAQRGFTLLELLITLSVTTIGLVGLLSLHLSVARGNDGASRSAEAQQLCAGELEALRALRSAPGQPLAQLMKELTGSTTLVLPSSRVRTAQGRNLVPYTITSTVSSMAGASASLVKIRVTVAWAEDGGTLGSNGGTLDHQIALEVIRTLEEEL